MADIISLLINNKACIQITTHSDYFIRRINELVLLNQIFESQNYSEEQFDFLCKEVGIPSYLKLNHNCIGAYLLHRRNDNTVEIVCQSTDDGVKFDSFYTALRQNIDTRTKLVDYLVK